MRTLRTMLLLAISATVAVAFTASTASAQGPNLKIENEPLAGGTHTACPAVVFPGSGGATDVDGGCLIHASSEGFTTDPTSMGNVILNKHVFGIESKITECHNEFHGRVDSAGEGYIFEQVLIGNGCTRQACKSGTEGIPWEAHGNEGVRVEETEYLTTNFCVEPVGGGTDETCEIDVPFNKVAPGNQHIYEFGHATELPSHGVSGFRCELIGHWISETGGVHDGQNEQEVEIEHVQ
jgi:hypothetical protein